MSLGADLYLAFRALAVHPLERILGKQARGKQAFLDRYGVEGLVPTTPEDKAMLAAAGRCISCGLCDRFDGQLGHLDRAIYDGASLLPRQYARSSVEVGRAHRAIQTLDPEAYRGGEAVCPTGVPLVAIGHWLKARLERLAGPGAAP